MQVVWTVSLLAAIIAVAAITLWTMAATSSSGFISPRISGGGVDREEELLFDDEISRLRHRSPLVSILLDSI